MLSHNIGTPRFRVTEAPHGHTSPRSLWQGRRHGQLHTRSYSFHSVHWPKQDTRSHLQGVRKVQPGKCPEEEKRKRQPKDMAIMVRLLQEKGVIAFVKMPTENGGGGVGEKKGYLGLTLLEHLITLPWPLALSSL